MNLVIVESRAKGNTIQKFLGSDYKVLPSYGHIRDLPKGEFGVDIEHNFTPKYVIPAKARKIVSNLKKEAKRAKLIILSTDPDREGEAIAWHLTQVLQLGKFQTQNSQIPNHKHQIPTESKIPNSKPYVRIVFHEITKPAIEEALKNPRKIDMNLVDAQQARRILDRIVGYRLSPLLWKKVARGLSAGRVQSVAVRLVVEREREIQNFKPEEYWSIEARLQKSQISKLKTEFSALLVKKNEKVIPKLGIKSKEEVDKVIKELKGAEYKIIAIEKKEIKRNPLPPFTTSTLEQTAWKRFHWPSKFTMRIAQSLYEKGLITYHRTDSLNLSTLSLEAAKKFIIENYGKDYWAGYLRKYKTRTKGAQEAHEAIRPTYPNKTAENIKDQIDARQFQLYSLIWQRFIACQMAQASFDSTIVEIEANSKFQTNSKQTPNKYIFRASGQTLKFDGFLKVYPLKYKEAELPSLEKGETLELIKLSPSQHFTQPPSRYTEATLIKTLEENGIGRPSTYAPIISTIQERNYVQKNEKKRFEPTKIGILVNDLLVKHFPKIVDIEFTAKMEKEFDEIAQGKEKWQKVINDFYWPFETNFEKKEKEISKQNIIEEKTDKKCPLCGAPLVIKISKFGKFYACSRFPECKYTAPLEENKTGIKCPKCGIGEIVKKRTKKGKIFYGCNRYPKCDFATWNEPTGEKCPKCGWPLVKTKRGQIKCSNPECDYVKKIVKNKPK